MSRRLLEIYEHETLHIGPSGLTEQEFDSLARFNETHDRRYFEIGHRRIKAKQYVGYLEVGSLGLEILPKADRGGSPARVWREGLVEMLRVTHGLRLDSPGPASQHVRRSRLLELLAIAFLVELEELQHHGLARGYRTHEANGSVFRGRLRVTDNLRENLARADRFVVEYQTYDHDIAVNRALLAALVALEACALSPVTSTRVQRARALFPEAGTTIHIGDLTRTIRLGRSTARYERALGLARMILEHHAPRLRGGSERVFSLLFDMNQLWEQYVATLFRRASIPGLAITTQERHAFWRRDGHRQRGVKPDIVIRESQTSTIGKVLLVVDTKWKVPAHESPSDEDLRQMFVYNELLTGTRAVLLYPTRESGRAGQGTYAGRSHTCEQMFLGVSDSRGWSTAAILAQIGELLRDVAASDSSTSSLTRLSGTADRKNS